jgi:hypothetical protein
MVSVAALVTAERHSLEVEHLYLANVCRPTKLVQIPIANDDKTGCASPFVERGQLMPYVLLNVVNFTGPGASLDMPGAYNYKISLFPADHAMSISGMIHVGKASHESPGVFVQHCGCPKVCLGPSDCSTGHVDLTAHFNALLVPKIEIQVTVHWLHEAIALGAERPEPAVTTDPILLFGKIQDVKNNDVILV